MNTNALEFDYSEPIPDFNFIEKQWTERQDEFEKTVVAMHGRPGSDVFNNNVSKVFQRYITQYPGLQFCIMRTTIDLLQTIFLKTASSITEATA